MKNKLPVLISCWLFSLTISAQATLTGSDLNAFTGQTSTVYECSFVSEGNSGADQTWDLSELMPTTTITRSYTSSTVPGATILQNNNENSTITSFDMKYDDTGQEVIAQQYNGSTTVGYFNPKKLLALPLVYNMITGDNYQGSASGTPLNGQLLQVVDGYGTLITPDGTFSNVLRVHVHDEFNVQTNLGITYFTGDTYTWYKAGIKDELASVTYLSEVGEAPYHKSALYLEASSSGLSDEEMGVLAVYPNPISQTFGITLSESAINSIMITDVQGRIFTCEYNQQGKTVKVNSENLNSGTYFIRVSYVSGKAEQAKITKL